MIYLASPYSHPNPAVMKLRSDRVCQAAAQFMNQGDLIFAPIAHSHHVADYGCPREWKYWKVFDTEFLIFCNEMWVLMLPGWRESEGVTDEIRIMNALGKPVRYVVPDTLEVRESPMIQQPNDVMCKKCEKYISSGDPCSYITDEKDVYGWVCGNCSPFVIPSVVLHLVLVV